MASTNPVKLTFNRQDGSLTDAFGGASTLRTLFQYDTVDFEISAADPGIPPSGSFSLANLTGYALRVTVGATPTGTSGGPAPVAIQTAWTYDSVNNKFVGSLALTDPAVGTLIGTSASVAAFFEAKLSLSGVFKTLGQLQFTLSAAVDEGTTTAPTPAASYLTSDEVKSQFVPRRMENGGTILIPSPSGAWGLLIGCNDDGTAKMDLIANP